MICQRCLKNLPDVPDSASIHTCSPTPLVRELERKLAEAQRVTFDPQVLERMNKLEQQRDELQTAYDGAHSELVRATDQLAACRNVANELREQRDELQRQVAEIGQLGVQLREQRDELLKEAMRYRWLSQYPISLRQWDYRGKHTKDLDAAIDAAMGEKP